MTVLLTPPQKRPLRHSPAPSSSSFEGTMKAIEFALEQKAQDVCGLDLQGVSDIADYFVIASGTSDRHVRGIVDKLLKKLGDLGERASHVSGYEGAQWVILDYGDFVIHIFHEPIRQYYSFDRLWEKAPRLTLSSELEQTAKKLRTGMIPLS